MEHNSLPPFALDQYRRSGMEGKSHARGSRGWLSYVKLALSREWFKKGKEPINSLLDVYSVC